jgi:hypothetical protein
MKRALLLVLLLISFLAAQTATEVEITAEPSHHLALENEFIRVFKVEVAPHASTLMHRHRHDYVFVTLGDAHVSNEVEGKLPQTSSSPTVIPALLRATLPTSQRISRTSPFAM